MTSLLATSCLVWITAIIDIIYPQAGWGLWMFLHAKDGSVFLGFRERCGVGQIVYDQHGGRRVILDIDDGVKHSGQIKNALQVAISSKDALSAVISELTSNDIKFHIKP